MDLAQGLTAASTALSIVKQLRELDAKFDAATFKMAIADLTEALADTKIALSEAKELLAQRDTEMRALRSQILNLQSGDMCPICRTGRMETKSVVDHPDFGVFGDKQHNQICNNDQCKHSQTKRIKGSDSLKY